MINDKSGIPTLFFKKFDNLLVIFQLRLKLFELKNRNVNVEIMSLMSGSCHIGRVEIVDDL